MPVNFSELTKIGLVPVFSSTKFAKISAFARISILLITGINGVFCCLNFSIQKSSCSMLSSEKTIMATSVFSDASSVFSTRILPSSPTSSKPAVSISTQAPMPLISIALYTGSVVVPATSDTIDTLCPVKALIKEDLPLLRLPKKPIWSLLAFGVSFKVFVTKSLP